MKKFLSVILSLILVSCAFFTSGIKTGAATTTDLSNANLLNTYGKVFGKVGTAMGASKMFDSNTLSYTKTQFNSVTPENEMKPDSILGSSANLISVADAKALGYYIPDGYTESTVPKLNFTTVDKMLQTCYENGLSMRGHTLVWHSQTPSWLFKADYNGSSSYVSQSVMNARMEFYIKSVMGHVFSSKYGSVIYAWDVVNEYFHALNSGSGWQQIYGTNLGSQPGFVKSAFQYAYQTLQTYGLTDKVKLFYNDYNEYMEVNDIVNLINYINSDGKICAGVGMQSHLATNFPSASYYKTALQSFVKAGFEIQITELDVTCSDLSVQAQYYYDLMSAILSVKKAGGNISAIVWWGLCDDYSWRSSQKPLLFSSLGIPKSAYNSVLQAYFDAGYTVTPKTRVGDVNGDRKVNTLDYLLMKRYIAGTITDFPAIEDDLWAGDINGDGVIDTADYVLLRTHILKNEQSFPKEQPATPTPTPTPTPATPTPTPGGATKLVALTFDDGPDATLTPLVLDKLDKYKVPATFMMVGKRIDDSTSAVIKRIVDSGDEIGNHSWGYSSMNTLDTAAIQKSINDTNAAIYKYSGTTPKFFRAPNLAYSSTLYSAVDLTFIQGVVAYDWDQTTTAETRANYIINGAKDGAIFLLHDVQPLPHPTPEALDIIIPELQKQGYEFVTLSELFRRKGITLSPSDDKVYTYLQ